MKNTLKELINEGVIIKSGLEITPEDVKFFNQNEKPYTLKDTSQYGTWKQKTIRFLASKYPKDRFVAKFEEEIHKFEVKYSPCEFESALGLLKAYLSMPKSLPSMKGETNSDKSIKINVSNQQTQGQSQHQSMVVTIFLDAIKNSLNEEQYKELQTIAAEEPDPKKAKTKILDTIKNFGLDTASLVLSNIISNPEVWKLFFN